MNRSFLPVRVSSDDPTLWPDILVLYQAIVDRIGLAAFVEWLRMEHPYLEKASTKLIRVWWVMQNYHDELYPPRPWLAQPTEGETL